MKKEKNPILEEIREIRAKLSRKYKNNHAQFILDAQRMADEFGMKKATILPFKRKKKK